MLFSPWPSEGSWLGPTEPFQACVPVYVGVAHECRVIIVTFWSRWLHFQIFPQFFPLTTPIALFSVPFSIILLCFTFSWNRCQYSQAPNPWICLPFIMKTSVFWEVLANLPYVLGKRALSLDFYKQISSLPGGETVIWVCLVCTRWEGVKRERRKGSAGLTEACGAVFFVCSTQKAGKRFHHLVWG